MAFLPFLKLKKIFTENKITALSKSVKPGNEGLQLGKKLSDFNCIDTF
jgi:hypothetical protein